MRIVSWRLVKISLLCIAPIISGVAQASDSTQQNDAFSIYRWMISQSNNLDSQPVEKIGFSVAGDLNVPNTTQLNVQPPGVGEGQVRGKWLSCESTSDPICGLKPPNENTKNLDLLSWSVLPTCKSEVSENCIEGLEISHGGAGFTPASLIRSLDYPSVPADSELNFIGGGTASLWHDKTNLSINPLNYLTNVQYGMHFNHLLKLFEITDFNVSIQPYREISGDYQKPYWQDFDGTKALVGSSAFPSGQIWFETGKAGMKMDFPENTTLRLKARVSNLLTGWFKGRLKDPQISIIPISKTNNLLTIEANPVTVPSFLAVKDKQLLTAKESMWRQNNGGYELGRKGGSDFLTFPTPYQSDVFEYIDHFRPMVGDKVAGTNSYWSLNSTNWGNSNPCLTDKNRVLGIVTTNAIGYSGASPRYEDSSLVYQVAGMHFLPDGKNLVEGTYDLLIRSEAARCLYGFSNAPVQATISITGEESSRATTTSMVERDGWIKFSAYGFSFSSPTIKIRLSQPNDQLQKANSSSSVASSSVASSSVAKKISITCVKGKVSKNVTGINPKCPTGYKKK